MMRLQQFLLLLFYIPSVVLQNNHTRDKLPGTNKIVHFPNHNPAATIRYDVPDDCRYEVIANEEIALSCSLKTINSEFESTNFSIIPSEYTSELNIVCNDEILTKSYLKQQSFKHLSRLKVLVIRYCKLSKFFPGILNGLSNLKNLTIQTHNNKWPNFNLNIERESFMVTKNLEKLDLSKNNMWSLPENLFCNMDKLSILNISENRLHDINELGFRTNIDGDDKKTLNTSTTDITCYLDLDVLDMSFNNFVLLPPNGFGRLKMLTELYLNNNEITMIADKALNGLKKLDILNLSSNRIVAIPSELFLDCAQSIQEIYLQNNSIAVMSPKLFLNLGQLQVLDLSFNQIKSPWIDKNMFLGLIRLVLLDLSHNKITQLEPEYFLDLYSLQILNIRHNRLEIIQPNTFSLLNNLHTLLLSYNNLKYLNAYSLNGLFVLSLLSIDNNELMDIHQDAFLNCSSLQDVNLNVNKLKTIPYALRNLRLLRTIDLGENVITSIEPGAFTGLNNLYGLRLIGNSLKNISSHMFDHMPNLQILNLAHNKIDHIEPKSFEAISSIQAIRLDGNSIADIGDMFVNIVSLLWLNISDNKLEQFDISQIPENLQWLDIHKNQITELSNKNALNILCLQTLDASFNQLTKLTVNSLPNSIELLFLNDNMITTVEPNAFLGKYNLTRVDLYANQIKTLDIKSLRILPVSNDKLLPEFYIGDNPFLCDCNIEWLQKINHVTSRQYPRIMDLDTIYCKLLNRRQQAFVSLVNATPKHFLCTYKTHCFALCHCCDFDACDCEMTCPSNCTCFHDQSWSTNIVECSAANYNEIPTNIPMDTTEAFIDGNSISELSGHSFIGRKNLAVLFANNSNIQVIYNTTFSGLKRLVVLHLEQNKIHKLNGNEFTNLQNLRELFLQNNKIYWISNETFVNLKELQILRLDGNKLVHFEIWQLKQNLKLNQIGLSENMWSCECSYLIRFRNFLQLNTEKIIDANRVACIYNNMSSIMKEKNGTKCTLREGISPHIRASEIENFLPLLLVGICAFICFFSFILGVFCYRQELQVLARSNCLLKLCFRSTDQIDNCYKDRFYDAYMAYSLQDERFVKQILADTLENDVGYKLRLHYRDLNLNLYITDAIIETVDNSKQAIFVLSKHFLYNEWTRFEYKSALHEIINKHIKIIFILYGELPQRDIDMDMRHYLKTNTCIEWDDKKFWQKLRTALPQPTKQSSSAGKTSAAPKMYGSPHDFNTVDQVNSAPQFDCESLRKMNTASRQYKTNLDTLSCKYKTVQHNNNSLKISTIGRKHHGQVPCNYATTHAANYDVKLDKKLEQPDGIGGGCEFFGSSNCTSLLQIDMASQQRDRKQTTPDSGASVRNLSISESCSPSSINAHMNGLNTNSFKSSSNIGQCHDFIYYNKIWEDKPKKTKNTVWS